MPLIYFCFLLVTEQQLEVCFSEEVKNVKCCYSMTGDCTANLHFEVKKEDEGPLA